MATNAAHSLVLLYLSTTSVADALSAGKKLVCEEDSSWASTSDVSTIETKCGNFQIAGTPTNTLSGTGVAVGDLASDEVSLQQLKSWINAQTTLYFAYQNSASGTLTAGVVVYCTGSGYFSSVEVTANTGDKMVKFSWEFAVNGSVDTTP
jgi:hypothetical protein